MPFGDGTGPQGLGPGTGRGLGRGRGMGRGGSSYCVCPACGYQLPHAQRGVPCSAIKCPKCGTPMLGRFCQ
jgi:hypothetical protein